MTEIRTEAKTWVVTDDGKWIKVWDAREPIELSDTEKQAVAGGVAIVNW